MEDRDPLTEKIIGAAIEVHRVLGPGLLETVYERAFCHELTLQQISHVAQHPVPIRYKELLLGHELFLDVLVDGCVVVELKSVEHFDPIHTAQLLTYMKLAGLRTGLLINFNVRLLKDGVKRLVL